MFSIHYQWSYFILGDTTIHSLITQVICDLIAPETSSMRSTPKHCLFFLGHPAHFHLFRGTIEQLKLKGYRVTIFIKKKDILESLLQRAGWDYINALPAGRADGKLGIAIGVIKKNIRLLQFCLKNRPDWMAGTSAEIAHIGFLLRIKSFVFSEDDYSVISTFARVTYPFATHVVSPNGCDNGKWNSKTIRYAGYHKLAYLHPNRFIPDPGIVDYYFPHDSNYFIIRLAQLNAHHDDDAKGITNEFMQRLIHMLQQNGNVYITSERAVPQEFSHLILQINPLHIHHIMAFASIYIGDSQSMAVEAAVIGTPNVRISSFSGKISVLEELEHQYQLTFGIHPKEESTILETIEKMIRDNQLQQKFQTRRQKMLSEKMDVTAWLIELFTKEFSKRN
jgi:predicted glycosyltransferase